jgi:hypothetical protein
MKADNDNSEDARANVDAVDPVDAVLARARRATDGIEPPADFTARVLTATSRPRSMRSTSWWAQLGPAGWRVVPFAAVAAAAAMALAWSADAHLDETADAAMDIAQGLP